MRYNKFSTTDGIVTFQPIKGRHWVRYIDQDVFDSYGCPPPKYYQIFSPKRYGKCVFLSKQHTKNR